MDTDYTLRAMESCDFSAPLSVTIIEDDSDQDTKDNLDLYEHDNYYNCPTQKLYIDTEVDDKSTNLEEEKDRTDKRSTDKQKLATINKSLIDKISKDKDKCVKKTPIKKKKEKKKKSKSKKENKTKSPKYSALTIQKDRDLEPVEAYTEPSSATKKIDANDNDSFEKRINSNVNSEDKINKNDENNEETNRYVNDLLTKVSESLLYVLDAYHNHLDNVLNKHTDLWYLHESKRRYTRIKQHFYQLSYCTTNIIILAQENNTKFTEEFLKNTVKLSEVKNNKKITVQQIQPLYYEMLSWAKQKKELHSIPVSPVITENKSSPLLRKQLREPPRLPTVQYPPNSNNFSIPKVSIHNDPHNREIRISLEPNSPQVNNETQPNHIPCNIVPKPIEKLIQREYYETEKRYEVFDHLRSYQLHMHNANYDTRKHYRSSISEVTSSTANVYKNSVVDQNRCMVTNCNYLEQHQHSKGATNPMNMRFSHPKPPSLPVLPTYEQAFYWNSASVQKTDENQPANNVEYNNMNAQSKIDTTRSSVSTDSGFISPQQLISPMENTVSEEIQNAQVTPLITHVTSLNPMALQILEHSCYVCGTTTNKKCLGCYHVYYCSYQCQRLDWNNHMAFCKSNTVIRATNYIQSNVIQ